MCPAFACVPVYASPYLLPPPGPRGITPAFGYSAPHPSARGTSTLLNNALLSAHYADVRLLASMPARSLGSRACSFSACSWLLDYAGPDQSIAIALRSVWPSRYKHTVGARIAFFEAQFPARRCLCLRFSRHLAAPSARLEVKMVRYSFLVGLFHPRLHAGLSRRLRLLTRAARLRFRALQSRDR